jgi:hypothetical protein
MSATTREIPNGVGADGVLFRVFPSCVDTAIDLACFRVWNFLSAVRPLPERTYERT